MKHAILVAAAAVSLAGCATTDHWGNSVSSDPTVGRAVSGAAIGAAAGAGVQAIRGRDVLTGAAVGAAAGGAIGAATAQSNRWYRDDRGACYYIDRNNQRVYDYNRNC